MAKQGDTRVVIVGAGFGGLNAARTLAKATFKSQLSTAEITTPFSRCFTRLRPRGFPGRNCRSDSFDSSLAQNIEVLMSEVTGFDLEHRIVKDSRTRIFPTTT